MFVLSGTSSVSRNKMGHDFADYFYVFWNTDKLASFIFWHSKLCETWNKREILPRKGGHSWRLDKLLQMPGKYWCLLTYVYSCIQGIQIVHSVWHCMKDLKRSQKIHFSQFEWQKQRNRLIHEVRHRTLNSMVLSCNPARSTISSLTSHS